MVLLLTINTYSQINNYIFERKPNELATVFFERHFEDFCGISHSIQEGYWGDESKGKKIVVFCACPIIDKYNKESILVFQPIGDGINYLLMPMDREQIGVYSDEILSVFYLDANMDGYKELFMLIKGVVRTHVAIEETDEQGITTEHITLACCEDIYQTVIIEQSKYLDGRFLPVIEYFSIENECDFEGFKTADEVKARLEEYLEKGE